MRVTIKLNKAIAIPLIAVFFTILSGCTTVLVSPYDEKLVTDTEEFYKKAAEIIEEGRSASPLKDSDRAAIDDPSMHSGHFTQFESDYNSLIIDAEAMMLRAMASDNKINSTGQTLQSRISEVVENISPSNCQELSAEFENTSLTAKNYVDLKCIVLKWKEQHSDMELTGDTQILKKANWEGRKLLVFNAVLAIQEAEGFKKRETNLEESK
ncbi:hypothetical protein FEI13_18390 [Halomonas urmiana]|uniref:Lipoprotein n=1 Tax=Halomonas urmiana TaxID=490901 RepID=A0A5R8M6C7_9GAMM|nr:hypothetical protein [Halomonas urmiana]TLF45106.1 hypothetical protein FEI13_18390 [Halomonas urmiana]